MTTLAGHARETLRRLMLRVSSELEHTRTETGVDAVHDVRVAIRRLSAALRAFSALFPDKEARDMRRALKDVLDAAAVVRDLDVGLELLRKERLAKSNPLIGQMSDERTRAAYALVGHVYLLKAHALPELWLPRLEALKDTGVEAAGVARERLPVVAAEFFRAGRKTAQKTTSAARLHEFRLAAKRFRYTLELYRDCYGPVFGERLERVRSIQSILGQRQDYAVMEQRLRPIAANDAALQATLTRVETRGARLEADFHAYWHREFDAEGEESLWERYLARHQPHPREQA